MSSTRRVRYEALPDAVALMPDSDRHAVAFIRDLSWREVPEHVQARLGLLLLDFAAVCVAGRVAPAAGIAADYAAEAHGGDAATALLDGRRMSPPGAAWANGVLGNVLDYDDGHRLTKGHPGANVIPAALALAEATDATVENFLIAVLIGYEIGIRAGIALHDREHDYHASGAWGGIGGAAAAARLLGIDSHQLRHAIGIAEYHAPIALLMKSVADPSMTKDATGWGAHIGVSSAMLAARGYTAASSEFLRGSSHKDLGDRWEILDTYVKAYPCCRWTQPPLEAARLLVSGNPLQAETVASVTIRTFAAADGFTHHSLPQTTEEAQYNLVWPVAVALTRGQFTVDDVLGGFDDAGAAAVAGRTVVVVDDAMSRMFPQQRVAELDVRLVDGTVLRSGLVEAPGDPDDPGWVNIVRRKGCEYLGEAIASGATATATASGQSAETLGVRSADELVRLMALAVPGTVAPPLP